MDQYPTKHEQEFLDIMYSFPIGHTDTELLIGKWFEDKDLLETVKRLYKLKDKILSEIPEQEILPKAEDDKTRYNGLSIDAKATEYVKDVKKAFPNITVDERTYLRMGFTMGSEWMRDTILEKPQP